jgi:hypothetical protein
LIGPRIPKQRKITAEAEKKIDKVSIIPQRTRFAKLSKSLVAVIIEGVEKNAAGLISAGLVKRLAVFQQLPTPLQVSVRRPAPRGCRQIFAIISGSINFTLAKH